MPTSYYVIEVDGQQAGCLHYRYNDALLAFFRIKNTASKKAVLIVVGSSDELRLTLARHYR
jgi:hypothetical protein